ncbi:hypothetical protein ACN47E_002029 [Coniothyrium glycines]
MPPHLRSTSPACTDNRTSSIRSGYLFKAFLLFIVLITFSRSLVLSYRRSKKKMKGTGPHPSNETNHMQPVLKKNDSGNSEEIMSSPRMYPPIHANQYLQSLRQEALQPALAPIHPWIAPPTPLPGPYDAPYYPLPFPTICKHAGQPHRPEIATSGGVSRRESTDSVSSIDSETLTTRSYTRRASDNAGLPFDPVLEGSTTVSTAGWRRTQWTVSAG